MPEATDPQFTITAEVDPLAGFSVGSNVDETVTVDHDACGVTVFESVRGELPEMVAAATAHNCTKSPAYMIRDEAGELLRVTPATWAAEFNKGRPVFVAPDPAGPVQERRLMADPDDPSDWTGWVTLGATTDGLAMSADGAIRPTREEDSSPALREALADMRAEMVPPPTHSPILMQLALDLGKGARVAPLGVPLDSQHGWIRVPGLATVLARETGLRHPQWGHQFTPELRKMAADMTAGFPAPEKSPAEALSEALECDSDGIVDLVGAVGKAIASANGDAHRCTLAGRHLLGSRHRQDECPTYRPGPRCEEPLCPSKGELIDPATHVHGEEPLPGMTEP